MFTNDAELAEVCWKWVRQLDLKQANAEGVRG
jgi:hypothetical protein